jgi:hypothetical protein
MKIDNICEVKKKNQSFIWSPDRVTDLFDRYCRDTKEEM